jgi:hypothetical protein
MHFSVAFAWSAVFLFVVLRSGTVRDAVQRPAGVAAVAAVYGPFVWLVMSLVVIPILAQRTPTFGVRWRVQLIAHIPFAGLPIVVGTRPSPGEGG